MKKREKTLRTPEDLLDAIPGFLGFKPSDSLVAVVIRDGDVHFTARLDAAAIEHPEGPAWFCERLISLAQGPRTIFLVCYSSRSRACDVINCVIHRLGDYVVDALVVDGETWWFADDKADHQGRGVPSASLNHSTCRADIAASIAAPSGDREDEMLARLIEAIDRDEACDPACAGKAVVAMMNSWVEGKTLSDADFLTASVTMSVGQARDEVWRVLNHKAAKDCLDFWKEVCVRTPTGIRTPALGVTGMVAWIAGDGALLNICLEQAEEADHPLINLLTRISLDCLPPSSWERVISV